MSSMQVSPILAEALISVLIHIHTYIHLRLLPTFAGVFRGLQKKKIRARSSFNKSLTNYTSEQSLINGVYGKNIF